MISTFNHNLNNNSKSKFTKLNFNLKNYIFSFLRFEECLFSVSRISKKFTDAIKSKKLIKIFTQTFAELLREINFDKKSVEHVKQFFANCDEADQTLNQLCAFLLLQKHKFLEILVLREKKDLHFEVLAYFISQTTSIFNLDLYDTAIVSDDLSLKVLSKALALNKSIHVVNLNFNKIGEKPNHMLFLSDALKQNSTLKKAYFFGNLIGKNENDFFYLSEALSQNSTLELICIDQNKFTDFQRDSGLLANALRNNKSLKEIQITYNEKLEKKETQKLFKKANKNLRVK